jgi:hypothetical protein
MGEHVRARYVQLIACSRFGCGAFDLAASEAQ